MERSYTTKELAQMMGVTLRTVYRWISDGTCKAVRSPKRYVIPEKEYKRLEGLKNGKYV